MGRGGRGRAGEEEGKGREKEETEREKEAGKRLRNYSGVVTFATEAAKEISAPRLQRASAVAVQRRTRADGRSGGRAGGRARYTTWIL